MENVVTKGAKPAEPMPKLTTGIPDGQTGTWEDLGGPTPENYRADDDSAKLKEPGATLSQVKNVVNKGAKSADPMKKMSEEAEDEEEEATEEDLEAEEALETEAEEGEEEVEEEFNVEEDVNALPEIKEQLQGQYEESLVEQVQGIKEELTDRVDAYLEYVADEWFQENALAVEHGLKTEMTESFLAGMKGLFEDHYVTIPEDKYDVIESMVDKLDEMEAKLNEQIERNVALNRRLAESVADVIFAEVTEGLALSQKDKLASLAENVEFESEADYREKLVTLRESYFPTNAGTQRDNSENLSEENSSSNYQPVSGLMESYLQTLNRVSKK
jgi:hypothetical protein